jgi:hypothetical protein
MVTADEIAGIAISPTSMNSTESVSKLTAKHRVATPVNWKQGDDVIIVGSVSDDEAKEIFGEWETPKPYIRIVPQPR